MKQNIAIRCVVPMVALIVMGGECRGQEPQPDATTIHKLLEQLRSTDFTTREKATKELAKLHDVPDGLREAAKSTDVEVRRRAEGVLKIITDRSEEKAFQAMVADLQKIEVDRFVRRMVNDEKFAGDKQWDIIQTLTKAVMKKANELGGRKYEVPDFDMKAMPLHDKSGPPTIAYNGKRILVSDPNMRMVAINGCVVLCTGTMPRSTSVTKSILIVDGDFTGATGLDNCLLIVRGKVGRFTGVRESVIISTGEFGSPLGFGNRDEVIGATVCDHSFLQVKNSKIRFTKSDGCTLIKTLPTATGSTTSRVLDVDKGPLQMLKFSELKLLLDQQLRWGKEVNGLAVAIAPTDRPNSVLIRWKNVGKETLELPWIRFNSDVIARDADDLWSRVYLKGADGKLLPARQNPAPRIPAVPRRPRTMILEAGKTQDETIDLWTYVERPPAGGTWQMMIELHIANPLQSTPNIKSWSGKIQSNELALPIGK